MCIIKLEHSSLKWSDECRGNQLCIYYKTRKVALCHKYSNRNHRTDIDRIGCVSYIIITLYLDTIVDARKAKCEMLSKFLASAMALGFWVEWTMRILFCFVCMEYFQHPMSVNDNKMVRFPLPRELGHKTAMHAPAGMPIEHYGVKTQPSHKVNI